MKSSVLTEASDYLADFVANIPSGFQFGLLTTADGRIENSTVCISDRNSRSEEAGFLIYLLSK